MTIKYLAQGHNTVSQVRLWPGYHDLKLSTLPHFAWRSLTLKICSWVHQQSVQPRWKVTECDPHRFLLIVRMHHWTGRLSEWISDKVLYFYSQVNIIIALVRVNIFFERKIVNISVSISFDMCFGCSKQLSHWDISFEYPQDIFWLRKKKISFSVMLS